MAYNFFNPYHAQLMNSYGQYQPQQNSIQNGGFVRVPNEAAARNYPIAPGNSITFIDENAPYCYTMTMGFSQFDRPKFEKFRLVKEEDVPQTSQPNAEIQNVDYALKSELEELKQSFFAEIEGLKSNFEKKFHKFEDETENLNLKKEVDLNG